MEYLPFRIAGRDFVIDAARIRAITPFDRLNHPDGPESPLVPVIDLRDRLSLPRIYYGRRPYLVVVETNATASGLAGFVADYVSDLVSGFSKDFRGGKLRAPRARPRWVLDPDSFRIASGFEPRSAGIG